MKAGQLWSLPVNYSCVDVCSINNALNKSSLLVWLQISSWFKFLFKIHPIYLHECGRILSTILHIPCFFPCFFLFFEAGVTDLAIPFNSLSGSHGSSIRQTKTKCSMGYNSVRLVQEEDSPLCTSISLWCHCGILYWYTHTQIHTSQGYKTKSYMAIKTHKPPWCLHHRQKMRFRC